MNIYIKTFFDEKDINLDERFEVTSQAGTVNSMTYQMVVTAIHNAPKSEQAQISSILRHIDFNNGDVKHFLRYLAQALTIDM